MNKGWYPDPSKPGYYRWWDGNEWQDLWKVSSVQDSSRLARQTLRRQNRGANLTNGVRKVFNTLGVIAVGVIGVTVCGLVIALAVTAYQNREQTGIDISEPAVPEIPIPPTPVPDPSSEPDTPPPAPEPEPVPPPSTEEVYYKNCAAVYSAGKSHLTSADPGYRDALDGNNGGVKGVACENPPG